MDNKINFTGSFLLLKPNPKCIDELCDKVIPRRSVIAFDLFEKGDLFFGGKDCYDRSVIDALRARMIDFKYFPNVNLKCRLNSNEPETIIETLKGTKVLTEDSEIAKYAETLRYPFTPLDYRWREYDHIDQTFKALGLRKELYYISNLDHVTLVRDKGPNGTVGKLRMKISPNDLSGTHYVIKYPKYSEEEIELLEINYKSEITGRKSLFDSKQFLEKFKNAIIVDKKKKRASN